MAEAVESALADKRHLIVEAGTGTGKTLAYLVPALLSGKRIVVSTGTKNLQEQLFFKDIPFLQQHFARPLKVCYMKGRDNYACRQKIYDAEQNAGARRASKRSPISRSSANGRRPPRSATAPRSRRCPRAAPPGPRSTRAASSAPGRSAPITSAASSPLMHQRAMESDIIIVNHHLFFADLSLRDDETRAASCPSITRWSSTKRTRSRTWRASISASSVSNYRFQELRRDIAVIGRMKKFGTAELDRILQRLEELAAQFFSLFGEGDRRVAFTGRDAFREDNEEIYTRSAGRARPDRRRT